MSHLKFEVAFATCQNTGNQDLPFRSWSTSSPGGKSEVPAMSSGDAPELYPPNVDFPPGRLQVYFKKKIVTNKIQTFWPFDLSFPQSSRCVEPFSDTVVVFSALFGLLGARTAKISELLFGLVLLEHIG